MPPFDYFNPPPGVYPPAKPNLRGISLIAFAAAGDPVRYRLGKGGRNPSAPLGVEADCSGFSAWCQGHDRRQFAPGSKLGDPKTGEVWFDTRTIVADAKAKNHLIYRLVPRSEPVLPGMLLVYPPDDELGLRYGHVTVITKVLDGFVRGRIRAGEEWWRFLENVDCSTGRGATAIRLRKNAKLWAAAPVGRNGYIVTNIHVS